MAAVLGLIIGVVIGVFVKPDIPIIVQPNLPIMVVAALDALLLGFLGNQLGVGSQLQTAVIVVLGIRIFSNVSAIRRFIFRG